MSQFIDRRPNASKKSTVNRQRLLKRVKTQLKEAVSDAISKRSITDINQGETIYIPRKDLEEPRFHHGQGGRRDRVLPGNDTFIKGDKIKRPPNQGGGGSGGDASQSGEGEDDFVFQLSRDEFLEIFFEDLALPDLIKKDLKAITTLKTQRAGFTTSGTPTNINVLRSMKQASARRTALGAGLRKKLKDAELALLQLTNKKTKSKESILELETTIAKLKRRLDIIPFIDTLDLRYNHRIKIPVPTTQAVMFCLMDVSGSMDEAKKEIAKRFFILLYLFLTKNYEKISLVFIRHHTSAKAVTEEEFFYSRETGGTVVSSALELLQDMIHTHYSPSQWNIYVAQASDGDNWNADSPFCQELLTQKIMPST